MSLKAVMLDFWGTIFFPKNIDEYRRKRLRDIQRILSKYGYRKTISNIEKKYYENRVMIDRIRKVTLHEISLEGEVIAFLDKIGVEYDHNIVRELSRAYINVYYRYTIPIDGLEDFLIFLKHHNLKTAIVSNTMHGKATKYLLFKYGLNKYIDVFVMSDEVGFRKPHPLIFRYALRKLGVKKNECIMIGDEKDDVCGATRIGITPILIDHQNSGKRYECEKHRVRSFNELKKLLLRSYL
ncbi:MAG: HAD family hydrolase [Thermoproteales archaeon]|nr:HAD family hydrolase [Thermoproteales archaeon]